MDIEKGFDTFLVFFIFFDLEGGYVFTP